MKNVHLLQTETYPAKLQLDRDYGTLTILDEPCIVNGQDFVGANLYITSNEEIQIDEWCFEIYNRESTAVAPRFIDENNNTWWLRQINMSVSADDANCKKIILTTDQELIKDGVQAIDDEFLEWFVKNPNCESVEVSYEVLKPFQSEEKGYLIHCPDNEVLEEPKQETIREVVKRYYEDNIDESNIPREHYEWEIQDLMIGFAYQWQQERMYNKEKVDKLLDALIQNNMCSVAGDELIEEFKNK